MPKLVSIPGIGEAEFPDDADESQILDALRSDYPDVFKEDQKKAEAAPVAQAPQIDLTVPQRSIPTGGLERAAQDLVGTQSVQQAIQEAPQMTPEQKKRYLLEEEMRDQKPFLPGNAGTQARLGALQGIPGLGGDLWGAVEQALTKTTILPEDAAASLRSKGINIPGISVPTQSGKLLGANPITIGNEMLADALIPDRVKQSLEESTLGQLPEAMREVAAEKAASKRADEQAIQTIRDATKGTKFVGDVMQTAVRSAPMAFGGAKAGIGVMSIMAGIQSSGGSFANIKDQWIQQGLTEEQASDMAVKQAALNGLITMGATRLFGATGTEAVGKNLMGELLASKTVKGISQQALRNRMKTLLVNTAKEMGMEAPEEMLDQLGQAMLEKFTSNPDKTYQEVMNDVVQAGVLAPFAAGVALAPTAVTQAGAAVAGEPARKRSLQKEREAAIRTKIAPSELEGEQTGVLGKEAMALLTPPTKEQIREEDIPGRKPGEQAGPPTEPDAITEQILQEGGKDAVQQKGKQVLPPVRGQKPVKGEEQVPVSQRGEEAIKARGQEILKEVGLRNEGDKPDVILRESPKRGKRFRFEDPITGTAIGVGVDDTTESIKATVKASREDHIGGDYNEADGRKFTFVPTDGPDIIEKLYLKEGQTGEQALAEWKAAKAGKPPAEVAPEQKQTVQLLREEGVAPEDAQALIDGTKTVEEIVSKNMQGTMQTEPPDHVKWRGPNAPKWKPRKLTGHEVAWTEGYKQAVERLNKILGKTAQKETTAKAQQKPGFAPPPPPKTTSLKGLSKEDADKQFDADVRAEDEWNKQWEQWAKSISEKERLIFDSGSMIKMITPDATEGGWRVTSISKRDQMPWGHTTHKTRLDALKEVKRDTRIEKVPFEVKPLEKSPQMQLQEDISLLIEQGMTSDDVAQMSAEDITEMANQRRAELKAKPPLKLEGEKPGEGAAEGEAPLKILTASEATKLAKSFWPQLSGVIPDIRRVRSRLEQTKQDVQEAQELFDDDPNADNLENLDAAKQDYQSMRALAAYAEATEVADRLKQAGKPVPKRQKPVEKPAPKQEKKLPTVEEVMPAMKKAYPFTGIKTGSDQNQFKAKVKKALKPFGVLPADVDLAFERHARKHAGKVIVWPSETSILRELVDIGVVSEGKTPAPKAEEQRGVSQTEREALDATLTLAQQMKMARDTRAELETFIFKDSKWSDAAKQEIAETLDQWFPTKKKETPEPKAPVLESPAPPPVDLSTDAAEWLTVDVPDVGAAETRVAELSKQRSEVGRQYGEIDQEIKRLEAQILNTRGPRWNRGQIKKSTPKKQRDQYKDLLKKRSELDQRMRQLDQEVAPFGNKAQISQDAKRVNDPKLPLYRRLGARVRMESTANKGRVPLKLQDVYRAAIEQEIRNQYPDIMDDEMPDIRRMAEAIGVGTAELAWNLDQSLMLAPIRVKKLQEAAKGIFPRGKDPQSLLDASFKEEFSKYATIDQLSFAHIYNPNVYPVSAKNLMDRETMARFIDKMEATNNALLAEAERTRLAAEKAKSEEKRMLAKAEEEAKQVGAAAEKVARSSGVRTAKEIKEDLVSRLEKLHKAAPEEYTEGKPRKVAVGVPGDGVFVMDNIKASIGAVLARAKSLDTTSQAPTGRMAKVKGAQPVKAKGKQVAEILKTLKKNFTNSDTARGIGDVYSDGKTIISTDGASAVWITLPAPVNKVKGFPLEGLTEYSNKAKGRAKTQVNTEDLWRASRIVRNFDTYGTTKDGHKNPPTVVIYTDAKGNVFAETTDAEGNYASYGSKEGKTLVGKFDGERLESVIDMARRVGNETVKIGLLEDALADTAPVLVVDGTNFRGILMGIQTKTTETEGGDQADERQDVKGRKEVQPDQAAGAQEGEQAGELPPKGLDVAPTMDTARQVLDMPAGTLRQMGPLTNISDVLGQNVSLSEAVELNALLKAAREREKIAHDDLEANVTNENFLAYQVASSKSQFYSEALSVATGGLKAQDSEFKAQYPDFKAKFSMEDVLAAEKAMPRQEPTQDEARPEPKRPDIWTLTDQELSDFIEWDYGIADEARAGKYTFSTYEAFKKYVDDRYAERDLDGMLYAYKEADGPWKVRYIKENRDSSSHKRAWIANLATGAPIPADDPPKPRTTPRPTATGEPEPVRTRQPSAQEPAGPPPPDFPTRTEGSKFKPFDITSLIQLMKSFGKDPTVNKTLLRRLKKVYGRYVRMPHPDLPFMDEIQLAERLLWDPELAQQIIGHELGHFIDLGTRPSGLNKELWGKFAGLGVLRERLAKLEPNDVLLADAKRLSAMWRGPWNTNANTPYSRYRNSSNELFADLMSALFVNPDMVNKQFPRLHDAFEVMLRNKPEFRKAYEAFNDFITGNLIVQRVRAQMSENTDKTLEKLSEEKTKERKSWRSFLMGAVVTKWHRAIQKERSGKVDPRYGKVVGESLKDVLETSHSWAITQDSLAADQMNLNVVPWLEKVAGVTPDVAHTVQNIISGRAASYSAENQAKMQEAMKLLNQYSQANRTIGERRAAGKWIEENPVEARDMLVTVLATVPELQRKWGNSLRNTPDSGLYDLAARIFFEVHAEGPAFVNSIANQIDNMDLDVTGQAALMAFNVRGKLLNPQGLTPSTAQQLLNELKAEIGPERYAALEKAAEGVRQILYDVQKAAVDEGLISQKAWTELIQPNKDNYVPYAVLDYFDGRVAAGIKPQVGTAKEIADTTIAMQLKVASLNRWRQRQRQTSLVKQMYERGGGSPRIVKLERLSDLEDQKRRNADDNISRGIYWQNGRPFMIEFQDDKGKTLQQALESPNFYEHVEWIANAGELSHVVMQMFTSFSSGFMLISNPLRGLRTGLNRVGIRSVLTVTNPLSRHLWDSMRLAANYANAAKGGVMDPQIRHLVENEVLSAPRLASSMIRDLANLKDLMSAGSALIAQAQRIRPSIPGPPKTIGQKIWQAGTFPLRATANLTVNPALRWLNTVFTVYEAFEKIQTYKAAQIKGLSESEAQALARRGGIPKPGVGGYWSMPMEVFFPWTRVHLQGTRADFEMLRDPEKRAGFITRFTLTEVAPRVYRYALAIGVMQGVARMLLNKDEDEDDPVMAEVFRRISPYKMAVEDIIPMWFYDPRTGEYELIATSNYRSGSEIPNHLEVVSIRLPASEQGRMWGPLIYNMLVQMGPDTQTLERPGSNIMTEFGRWAGNYALPGFSPVIETGVGLKKMILDGKNPDDPYTGMPSANVQMFDAGWGNGREQAVAGYLSNQLGGPGQFLGGLAAMAGILDPATLRSLKRREFTEAKEPPYLKDPTGTLRRLVSHDNYADYRDRKVKDLDEKQLRAQTKQVMSKPVKDLYEFYWRNKDRKDEMDAVDYGKLRAASQFVSKVWGNLDDPDSYYNKAAYAVTSGSDQNKETVRRDLDAVAMPWLAVFQNPDAARFTAVLHLGDNETAKVELNARQYQTYDKKVNEVQSSLYERIRNHSEWKQLTPDEQRELKLLANQAAREAAADFLLQNR